MKSEERKKERKKERNEEKRMKERKKNRKKVLLNTFHELNHLIDKNWRSLSLNSFKIICKDLFLKD